MSSTTKMIATTAFAVLMIGGLLLHAESAARLSTGDAAVADPGVSSSAEPIASILRVPLPQASMMAASPYSAGLNMGTPKVELFLGYSYLRAVPTLAAGNRLVYMNGGQPRPSLSTSIGTLGWLPTLAPTPTRRCDSRGALYLHSRREQLKHCCPNVSHWPASFIPKERQNYALSPGSFWRRACETR